MESMATRHGGKQEAKRPYDHVGLLFLKYVGGKSKLPNMFRMNCLVFATLQLLQQLHVSTIVKLNLIVAYSHFLLNSCKTKT